MCCMNRNNKNKWGGGSKHQVSNHQNENRSNRNYERAIKFINRLQEIAVYKQCHQLVLHI